AGALREEEDQPEHVRSAIDAIERSGSEAMTELDALIGVLRNDVAEDELDHQPTLQNLDRLFSNAEALGLQVAADVDTPDQLSPVIDRAAFRVIQESLTNAAKYANPGEVAVAVRGTADSIQIEVRNPTVRDPKTTILSGGQGLIGMNERLSVLGGTLQAGPTGPSEFQVLATLPLDTRPPPDTETASTDDPVPSSGPA
ncbi:MAG: sensor histidine kinase, partial [Acidimicrobiales bacterium]